MTLKRYANFEEKLTCGLKKDLRNLANFHHQFGKKRIYLETQSKGVYWFILKISMVFPIPTGRVGNRMMNIFIIVNITPTCRKEIV